jgi:hypothetical protein
MHRISDLFEFYSILYRIVKGWPPSYHSSTSQETRSERLNTFAVVRSLSDLDADNLKKTVEYASREHFFSRYWHDSQYQPNALRVDYPALLVREDTFTLSDPLDGKSSKRRTTHNLTFLLCDKMPSREDNHIDPVSSARRIEEVGNDCRIRMAQVLLVLGRFVWASGYLSNTLVFSGWFDRSYLESLKTEGVIIDKYIVDDSLASYITNVAPTQGEVFWEVTSSNLVVCSTTLTLEVSSCVDLPTIVYDDPVDPEVVSQIFEGNFNPLENPPS